MSLVHQVVVHYFGHTLIIDLHFLLWWSFDYQVMIFLGINEAQYERLEAGEALL
jgi:hypothetical protein